MKHLVGALFLVGAVTLGRACVAAAPAPELEPGLIGEYYNIGQALEDFPTIPANMKPTVKKVDKQINVEKTQNGFNGTDLIDVFYVRWTGKIKIAAAGNYTFTLESDDGSRLFIDGKQVVDNPGLHGMQEGAGEIDLKAGTHDIRIDYFDNDGDAGCKWSWAGPDIARQIVPASVLFHVKGAEK